MTSVGPVMRRVTGEQVRTDLCRDFGVIVKTLAFTLCERGSHCGFVQMG